MSETLLGCPFCGTQPNLRRSVEEYPADNDGPAGDFDVQTSVDCDECGISVSAEYRDEAIAAWNRRTPSLPASAEGGEAIDFVQELYSELRHQVNNCPVCKGEGMAVDVFDVLTKPEPREKTPCNRCSRARSLLDRVKPARTTLSEAKTHG